MGNALNENQYGFWKKRNAVNQLARVTYGISNEFNINRSTAALFLYTEKAFDTVWYEIITCKLRDAGDPTYITKIISSFSANRTFRVKMGNDFDTKKTVAAEVL